ncbi:VQ motif-containing protein 4 [Cicer arietinum]|uniref:VQ motif-containing protein 4 n=1 Tax=Cicer arietinum TaxID=3827 RepID=A0A1S2XFV1_CICAR|nr:VQ motif-containing protein 4 [Cicer arietinum]
MEITSRFHERENPSLSPMNSPKSNVSNCMSSSNSNSNCIQIQTPPLTPKTTIPRSDSNPYPTTFVQADTSTFKQVVQMLTGSSEKPTTKPNQQQDLLQQQQQQPPQSSSRNFNIPPIKTAPKKQSFKLYERRNSLKNSVLMLNTLMPNFAANNSGFSPRKLQQQQQQEILSPSLLDFPSLALSPVTPLNDDPFDKSSPSLGNSSEEDKAIAEKGFYLHLSPITTPRESEPQLLPLFPVTSPRVSSQSTS